ncbi:MAG: flavin reductase family protein [Pseudonocardiales bacterium]|nr:flavin reductase family protein [Pseudonocardiales bacterium]MBV9030591.1 flavin reductase family protein [Pseudonocardiales bacterium]
MTVDIRGAMRNFATGVCVATTYSESPEGRRDDAMTINSLTSVSMSPPLVSMCLRHDSGFLANVLEVKVWAVSMLDTGTEDIARTLAKSRHVRDAVVQTLSATRGQRTGALVLDSPSWLECELRDCMRIGDHAMIIGEVLDLSVQDRRPPLIFLHGRFYALNDGI